MANITNLMRLPVRWTPTNDGLLQKMLERAFEQQEQTDKALAWLAQFPLSNLKNKP